MVRKFDSGWRDSRLPMVHADWGVPVPVAGMSFPTVEYDKGEAVAVISYIRRDAGDLPRGEDINRAYAAFSTLRGPIGTVLPFITAMYDPRNWAMRLFAHNAPAAMRLGIDERSWLTVTEQHFVRLLYRLRDRSMPDLASGGVGLSTAPWMNLIGPLAEQGWPGQDMSVRRRAYEPEGLGVLFTDRNPCADIDLAVVGRQSGQVTLLVDYKLSGTYVNPAHRTHKAMAGLSDGAGRGIPSMIVKYDPTGDPWRFKVWCLNRAASVLLGAVSTDRVVGGWTPLNEHQWSRLLDLAWSS